MSGPASNPAEPTQLFLPMFSSHEIESMQQKLNAISERQAKRRQKLRTVSVSMNPERTKAISEINSETLDLPFGNVEDHELSISVDLEAETGEEESESPLGEEKEEWSQEAIDQLHEAMVMYSLRLLNARGNGKEKKAILSWIFDPHAMAHAVVDELGIPDWKLIKASDVPFSFELCCRISGYDPERIREGLVPVLKKMGLDALFNEIQNARDTATKQRADQYKSISTGAVQSPLDIRYPRGVGKGGTARDETRPAGRTEDQSVLRV